MTDDVLSRLFSTELHTSSRSHISYVFEIWQTISWLLNTTTTNTAASSWVHAARSPHQYMSFIQWENVQLRWSNSLFSTATWQSSACGSRMRSNIRSWDDIENKRIGRLCSTTSRLLHGSLKRRVVANYFEKHAILPEWLMTYCLKANLWGS